MPIRSWWRKRRERRRLKNASKATIKDAPLREFVYLDAVSLHSLLVSQKATIPTEVSQAISRAEQAELSGTVSADALVAKSESAARYQTSNSNTLQSSRKAVIQTLFKEFRDLPLDFKLASPNDAPASLNDVRSIESADASQGVEPATALVRGTLVEIEVTLAVDPVFKLGSMMTEYSAMADEYPAMFGAQGSLSFLRETEPIMRVLDRFLAGLIPVKAIASNHVVVESEGKEFVAHKKAIEGLDVKYRPLHIVGVTEHLGYWKDIRRVLFSEGQFTMLCRVARSGIQQEWTPVKLADLFSDVAPDFVGQINAIESPTVHAGASLAMPLKEQNALGKALLKYKDLILEKSNVPWPRELDEDFMALVLEAQTGSMSASEQRRAFERVGDFLVGRLKIDPMNGAEDLAARQRARRHAELELFPSLAINHSSDSSARTEIAVERDERLLDVEIISIYW